MRPVFPLFQSHIDFTHTYWKEFLITLKDPCSIIDATMGNGYDTLFLAQSLFPFSRKELIALDIDVKALENTKNRLESHGFSPELNEHKIELKLFSHEKINSLSLQHPCRLIVYNLGYLPGSCNKQKTTQVETTLESILKASLLLHSGGVISITSYPGHVEGEREYLAICSFLSNEKLSFEGWNITSHSWIHRKKSPVVFLLQKAL